MRLSNPGTAESCTFWLFLDECQICGKIRLQRNNKTYKPYVITSFDAQEAIKNASKEKNQPLFEEIVHLDLIAKEFKVHQICYQTYTLGYTSKSMINKKADKKYAANNVDCDKEVYEKSNFDEVKEYVNDIVIKERRTVSMELLHRIFK